MAAADLASLGEVVKNNPVFLYASMASGLVIYLATVSESVQKLLGPLGRWLAARQARRAQRASSRTDVRILDLQGQVDHVVPRLDATERELDQVYRYMAEHARWDWEVLEAVRRIDPSFPAPPPLRPPQAPRQPPPPGPG